MKIDSLAALKRYVAQPGATMTMLRHDYPAANSLVGTTRHVARVQTNGIAFQQIDDPESVSWLRYPPAKQLRFRPDDNEFDVCLCGDGSFDKLMTYRINEPS